MNKRKMPATSTTVGVSSMMRAFMKEVDNIEREGFIVDVDETNAKVWHVALLPNVLRRNGLDTLSQKLKVWAQLARKPTALVLELRLAERHPDEPPFVRVVRPRFVFHTGHVTIGGSICTKLLTTDGWRPELSIEAVLRSILQNMLDGKAAIDMTRSSLTHDYTHEEAIVAFKRVAAVHGWTAH